MPRLSVNGTELFYEDSGPGSTGQTIVFAHGLLWDTRLFAAQVAHFAGRYRCIAYDHRGQGRSADDRAGSIGIETVYQDAVALLEALAPGPVHFVGLSMGGYVAMRLGVRRPDLLRSLILMATTGGSEPMANAPRYRRMNMVTRFLGLGLYADRLMPLFFGRSFLTDARRAADQAIWRDRLARNRRGIWRAVNGVIEREGIAEADLAGIGVPTLVLVGDEDLATPPAKAEWLHKVIDGSRLIRIPQAGHLAPVEQPARVNDAIEAFLGQFQRQLQR